MLYKYFIATDIRAGKIEDMFSHCCIAIISFRCDPLLFGRKVDFYPALGIISTIQITEFKIHARQCMHFEYLGKTKLVY